LKSQKYNDIVDRRNDEIIFDLTSAQRRIAGMQTDSVSMNDDFLQRNESIDPALLMFPHYKRSRAKIGILM